LLKRNLPDIRRVTATGISAQRAVPTPSGADNRSLFPRREGNLEMARIPWLMRVPAI